MPDKMKRALVLAFEGIEEIEALTPVDLLRRAKVEVTLASVEGEPNVTGRNQITFAVDAALSEVENSSFDLVVLPGGPGVLELLEHPNLATFLLKQHQASKPLAALCAAPKLLAHHGILEGRRATSHASVRSGLPISSDSEVVVDGHLITSQGVGTAVTFSLQLVELLCGKETAESIAQSIHH